MPKLLSVTNPMGFRVEGPLLQFDEIVSLKTAVDLIAKAYQEVLREKGIEREVHTYTTTDTPSFRSYGIAVEGQKWKAPLFEVVSGREDTRTYTFTKYANPNDITSDELPLIDIDRIKMFDKYLGKEVSHSLSD